MISFGKSDKGKVRGNNEDYIYLNDNKIGVLPNLYVVSDGMGGHKAGEIASNIAVNSFVNYVIENKFADNEGILDFLVNAIDYANKVVYKKSQIDLECRGMGATLSACTFVNKKIYSVHVGDSRIYYVGKSEIKQLSIDHTYVNEMVRTGRLTLKQAENHPQKNIITRAIGIDKNIEVDAFVAHYNFDDCFLICSDGLVSMLDDGKIFDIIKNNCTAENKVLKLVESANENGGFDNISVILICEVQ